MSDYKLKNVCDFDLAQTLECGQCFHFVKLDEEDYVLAAKGHVLHVSQEDDTVTFYDTEEDEYVNVWKDYFDGLQPILDKKYDDENRSCNRLVTNFCRNITYSYLGYLAAPNHITYQSNNDISALIDILNYNDCSSED